MRSFLLAAALLAAPAQAAPDSLSRVLQDHWAWALREDPVLASSLGDRRGDGKLVDLSLAADDRRAKEAAAFLARLRALPDAGLSSADRANRDILARLLDSQVRANGFGQRAQLFNTYYGWHQGFVGLLGRSAFRSRADYDSYLSRLAAYPAYNREALRVSERAVAGGYAWPCSALGGYEASIAGLQAADPARSRLYEPFTRPRPADVSAADWVALQSRARRLIAEGVNPAFAEHLSFYRARYLPNCAKADGVSAQPDGAAFYAFRIGQETTTDLSADEVHRVGLAEVERIGREMDAVAKGAGFADRTTYATRLRTDPRHFARTPDELIAQAALTAKLIDGKLPSLIGRLPRLPYGVRAIPAEVAAITTTAYYSPGTPEAGLAGTYYVNTSKLDQRPLWELPALSLHEAVPGHHLQIALSQELDLPPFRRHLAQFNAFTEGWALYAERLGEEMGLYDTPEKRMGQLSYQMWRATRLVVDTGLHAKGWGKASAVAFMREHTALSDANIDAEVNRYLCWPGQALAYKLGELHISALRREAEAALGPRFDLRRFHDAVLAQGAVPLDLLERQVHKWVATEKAGND